MEIRTTNKGVVQSFNINGKSSLSTPLVSNKLSVEEWIQSVSTLRYILMPLCIINLFPDQKPTKIHLIMSYLYPLLWCITPYYMLAPNLNDYLSNAIPLDTAKYMLYIIYVLTFVNSVFVYCYIRWYFFRKRHHMFLLIHLYEYIKHSNEDALKVYYNTIHQTCKYCTILFYCFIIFVTILWIGIGVEEYTFYKHKWSLSLDLCAVFAYDYQVYNNRLNGID